MVIASEVLERALSEGPGDFKAGLALPVLYSIGEIQSLSVPPRFQPPHEERQYHRLSSLEA